MATNADLEALQAAAVAAEAAPDPAHAWPFGAHGATWESETPDAAKAPDPRWCEFQRKQSEWTSQLPEGLVSVQYDPSDPFLEEKCLAALGRDGAVILANAVSAETADQVCADMAPYIEGGSFLDGFYGKRSKRIGCLPARSRACDPIVAHPTLMKLVSTPPSLPLRVMSCVEVFSDRLLASTVRRRARAAGDADEQGGLREACYHRLVLGATERRRGSSAALDARPK